MTNDLSFHVPRFKIQPLRAPQLRKDPIIERWTIIATDRLGRPQEYPETVAAQPLDSCPFCAGREHLTPPATHVERGPDGWWVRAVPNTYPAVRLEPVEPVTTQGLLHAAPAHGWHEVIIACPQHEAKLNRLSAGHLTALFRTFRARMQAASSKQPKCFPVIFNNHRAPAGASLEHAHAQIIALPRMPELLNREYNAGLAYHQNTGRCKWCDLLTQELADGSRIIFETPRFVALAAYAGRCPSEVWLLPKAHTGNFAQASDADLADLASTFRRLLTKLDLGLDDPPYNSYIHSTPTGSPGLPEFHWHMEILPRLTGTAGFEWGADMSINPVPPEQAAAYLRGIGAE